MKFENEFFTDTKSSLTNMFFLRKTGSRKYKDYPEVPTTIKTMGVNITTIVYLLIIEIGSTGIALPKY